MTRNISYVIYFLESGRLLNSSIYEIEAFGECFRDKWQHKMVMCPQLRKCLIIKKSNIKLFFQTELVLMALCSRGLSVINIRNLAVLPQGSHSDLKVFHVLINTRNRSLQLFLLV